MGSPTRTLRPFFISEWRAQMASERSPRDVGKLVLWEEKQDWREQKGHLVEGGGANSHEGGQSSRVSIKGGGTSKARYTAQQRMETPETGRPYKVGVKKRHCVGHPATTLLCDPRKVIHPLWASTRDQTSSPTQASQDCCEDHSSEKSCLDVGRGCLFHT